MIRFAWMILVLLVATVVLAPVVIGASLLGVRGDLYTRITRLWANLAIRAAGTPVEVEGAEHVAPGRPAVVVSNHLSWFDIFALAAWLPGVYHFVGKKELNAIPLFGQAWRAAGHISIDRSNREAAIGSLRRAGERIRREGSVAVIYPEGTRARNGRLQPFKKGAFMLAIESNVPVVPLVVLGTFSIMRPDRMAIRPSPIRLVFLPPIPPPSSPAEAESLMQRVRAEMVAVLPPDMRPLDDAVEIPPRG